MHFVAVLRKRESLLVRQEDGLDKLGIARLCSPEEVEFVLDLK